MILSCDELEILDYLKLWPEKFIPLGEICRRAGGRRKFRDDPSWARSLMSRVVDAGLIKVNERGHYLIMRDEKSAPPAGKRHAAPKPPPPLKRSIVVGDDYFPSMDSETPICISKPVAAPPKKTPPPARKPAPKHSIVIGDDYFPAPE
jgi:hypothetical protein